MRSSFVLAIAVAAACLVTVPGAAAYDNGLGAYPPLGWSTWCTDDLCGLIDKCTQQEIQSIADAFVSTGMTKLGYKWLVLDDCWAANTRTADGKLQADKEQFPDGMAALVDYVHARGLKIGLYTCAGNYTCHDHRPGSFGHYQVDAETFAGWDIDYVKMDNCFHPDESPQVYYTAMSKALNATGHPMWFNTCEWGEDSVWLWGGSIAQSFRVGPDHLPFWKFQLPGQGGQGVYDYIERMASLSNYSKPYGWDDADFLMTGMPSLTTTDSITEFCFWAFWNVPMLISTDVRNMTAWKSQLVLNKDIIAINQDPARVPGFRVWNTTVAQAWKKPLAGGDIAVLLLNAADSGNQDIEVTWEQLFLPASQTYSVYDVLAQKSIGTATGKFTASAVEPHAVKFIRLSASSLSATVA